MDEAVCAIRPGTDGALALAMVGGWLGGELVDAPLVAAFANSIASYLAENDGDVDGALRSSRRMLAAVEQLQVQRLKKRKLKLKDEITWLESRLLPDIIA